MRFAFIATTLALAGAVTASPVLRRENDLDTIGTGVCYREYQRATPIPPPHQYH